MKNTELEQLRNEIENIISRISLFYSTMDDPKDFDKVENFTQELLALFQSHEAQIKQDIFKKVEGIIPYDSYEGGKSKFSAQGYNLAIAELRSSLKALEEKEIGE